MNGYWLVLYDGAGRRLGRPWWYETQAEAETEARQAFGDSPKIAEAAVWKPRPSSELAGWGWQQVAAIRRNENRGDPLSPDYQLHSPPEDDGGPMDKREDR
jgi:hypothetical protein